MIKLTDKNRTAPVMLTLNDLKKLLDGKQWTATGNADRGTALITIDGITTKYVLSDKSLKWLMYGDL